MWTATNDIGHEAFARLLSRADVGPSDSRERDLDAPAPRMLVLALALPAQIDEPRLGQPMHKRTPEHRLVRLVALADFKDQVEVSRFTRLGKSGMDLTLCILQAEVQWLIQRCARLHAVMDQADVDLPLSLMGRSPCAILSQLHSREPKCASQAIRSKAR